MPTRDEIIKAILPIMQAVRDGSLYDEDAADAVIATLLRMTEEPSEEMLLAACIEAAVIESCAAIRADQARRDAETPPKLWIWKNFVDGRPEFWAFDNPYPVHLPPNGDPMVLGEPVGYAIFKSSRNGRPDRTEEQVIAAIKSLKAHTVAETTSTSAENPSPAQGGGTNPL